MVKAESLEKVQRRQATQTIVDETSAFLEYMLDASGRSLEITPRQHENLLGYYLFWKGAYQKKTAEEEAEKGSKEWAERLEKSALLHATLALQIAPSIVMQVQATESDLQLAFPFHRARLLARQLAEEEYAIRGPQQYRLPLTERQKEKLGLTLRERRQRIALQKAA